MTCLHISPVFNFKTSIKMKPLLIILCAVIFVAVNKYYMNFSVNQQQKLTFVLSINYENFLTHFQLADNAEDWKCINVSLSISFSYICNIRSFVRLEVGPKKILSDCDHQSELNIFYRYTKNFNLIHRIIWQLLEIRLHVYNHG